ncbi:MAG: response regulator [Actinomycetota bacterium]
MSYRVLIVEDNATVRELLRVLLESDGYEIVEAKDGLEGLLKAEFAKPDLMILDLMMPDVDGERVIAQVRSDPELAHVPVLVVSGKYEALDRLRDVIGEENVFAKPFEPTKLMDRIGVLIGYPGDD